MESADIHSAETSSPPVGIEGDHLRTRVGAAVAGGHLHLAAGDEIPLRSAVDGPRNLVARGDEPGRAEREGRPVRAQRIGRNDFDRLPTVGKAPYAASPQFPVIGNRLSPRSPDTSVCSGTAAPSLRVQR